MINIVNTPVFRVLATGFRFQFAIYRNIFISHSNYIQTLASGTLFLNFNHAGHFQNIAEMAGAF